MSRGGLGAVLLVPLATLVVACSGGGADSPDPDAGPDEVDAAFDAAVGFEPTAPSPPLFSPCPAGWRETDDDPTTCEPWPEGGRAECAIDEAHFPGEPGCARIGTACPQGDWPEDLPGGDVIYVRAGVDEGAGDGTLDSPYGTIAEAMADARGETLIALAKGTYEEAVELRREVTLWGACVAETLITTSVPDPYAGTVTVVGDDAVVRNLRISGERAGIWLDTTSATLEGVIVDGARSMGLVAAYGAAVVGHDVVLRDTRSSADGRYGVGVVAAETGRVELTRAVVERNHEVGAAASSGGNLRLADAAILDTLAQNLSGRLGRGLQVQEGSAAELERVVIEGNLDVGAMANDEGTTLRATDVIIRDTGSRESDDLFGRGVDVGSGASVELTRVLFERNRDVAVYAHEEGSIITLTDVVVRHTMGQAWDDTRGLGLVLDVGAEASVQRVDLEDNQETGVLVRGAGTILGGSDVAVRDTRADPAFRDRGLGLEANSGAVVDLVRARFERNREASVVAHDADTTVRLADVAIVDTQVRDCAVDLCADFTGGVGVVCTTSAAIDVRRFVIATSALCGVQVALDGSLDLHEGEIRENPIGANVQVPDYDFGRLSDGVYYYDNDLNLDATTMPVPTPYDEPAL